MGDSLAVAATLIIAIIVMIGLPLMTTSGRNDDVAEIMVQTAVSEFVNNARTIGKITSSDYDKLLSSLNATGNTYDIQIEIQVLDENPAKKQNAVLGEETKIGENIYYSIYTTQIMDELDKNGVKYMKEGDVLKVSAANSNNTISQMLKNFFYGLSGNDTYSIVGSGAGIVTVTGS